MRKLKRVRITEPSAGEPTWVPDKEIANQLSDLLNWYSYNKTSEDAESYVLDYVKKYKAEDTDLPGKIKKSPPINTIGWVCRIVLNSGIPLPKLIERIDRELDLYKVIEADKSEPVAEEPEKKTPNIQEHIANQTSEFLAEIEEKIDQFISDNYSLMVDWQTMFSEMKMKGPQAKTIVDHVKKKILAELLLAQAGTDEQLVEGYSHLSTKQMNKFISFIQNLLSELEKREDIAKKLSFVNRSPRKRKPKPAGKQVEKLKYLKEHENLKSIIPSSIVGASQLWVYNVKLRRLGVYICDNAHGFSVKGCTILNYSPSESISKTLRKPEETIPIVLDAGKVALRKILPDIRSKEKKLNGRINKDVILLRAL